MPWTRLRQGVFVSVRVNSTESFLAPLITLILKTPTPLKCRFNLCNFSLNMQRQNLASGITHRLSQSYKEPANRQNADPDL